MVSMARWCTIRPTGESPATDVVGRRARPPPLPKQIGSTGWVWLILLVAVVVTGCWWLRVDPGPLDRFDAWITDAVISIRTGWLDTFAQQAHTVGSRVGFAALGVLLVLATAWFRRWRHLVIWMHLPRRRRSPLAGARAVLPAAAAVRRAAARELGGLRHAIDPDRSRRDPLDRGSVHARRSRPAAVLGEDRRCGCDRDHRRASDLPRRRPLHRRRVRCDRRCRDPAGRVPPLRPQRPVPGQLRCARQVGASRRHRASGRGDPNRVAGPARVHGAGHQAGRARGLRRLDPAEAHT